MTTNKPIPEDANAAIYINDPGRFESVSNEFAEAHTLHVPGPGKVIWPDGSEVTAEQFRDAETAATIAYAKGRAEGEADAGHFASEYDDAVAENERLRTRLDNTAISCRTLAAAVDDLPAGWPWLLRRVLAPSLGEVARLIRSIADLADPEADS